MQSDLIAGNLLLSDVKGGIATLKDKLSDLDHKIERVENSSNPERAVDLVLSLSDLELTMTRFGSEIRNKLI